jgi:hypothetical protein
MFRLTCVNICPLALDDRTPEVGQRVATVLSSSRPGDEDYLKRLQINGYQVSDEGSESVFDGPPLSSRDGTTELPGMPTSSARWRPILKRASPPLPALAAISHSSVPRSSPRWSENGLADSRPCGKAIPTSAAINTDRELPVIRLKFRAS